MQSRKESLIQAARRKCREIGQWLSALWLDMRLVILDTFAPGSDKFYELAERKRLGDPDKKTGVYAAFDPAVDPGVFPSFKPFRLVGIAGKAGAGKDTAARALIDEGYERVGFADPIKRMLDQFYYLLDGKRPNWDDREWKERVDPVLGFSPRQATQTLGTEWGRNLNENIWLIIAARRVSQAWQMDAPGVVIPDVRFENEAAWLRQYGLLIHVHREGIASVSEHSSEKGVESLPGDWHVTNNLSIDWLHRQVRIGIDATGFRA